MKKRILCMLLTLLMAFSTIPAGAFAQEESPVDYGTPGVDYAEGEAIVYVDGGAAALSNTNGRSRSAAAYETEELMAVEPTAGPAAENSPMLRSAAPASGKSLVLVKSGQDTESLIADLQSNPNVEFAEPNYYVQAYDVGEPTDPDYKDQWALKNQLNNNDKQAPNPAVDINAEGAWEQAKQPDPADPDKTPVVAVLDSGVDYTHPDLQNIMWKDGLKYESLTKMHGGEYGYNAIRSEDNSTDPMDFDIGHGTHCAGIIAAEWNNDKGVAGISPSVKIMAVRFLALSGGDTAGSIRGYAYIQAAAEAGVNVVAINNSWGPSRYDARQLRSISTAATAIGENYGVVSCFAAGNTNTNNDLNSGGNRDSAYVVAVGAMDSEGYKSFFSCYGQETVDVFAPGSQILSAVSIYDDKLAMNKHEMPVQYLPQIQDDEDSYFYEDFESDNPSVSLRLLDDNGKVIEKSENLSPGCASTNGLQLSLDSIENDQNFTIEMVFKKTDLEKIETKKAFNIAFQGGCDNAMYGQSFLLQYQNQSGQWINMDSTMIYGGAYFPARLRLADHNWNQSSQEVNLPDFMQNENEKGEVVLRLVPKPKEGKELGVMSGKTGNTAAFRLDDVGFGKRASDYYYSDGTSMAAPVVTGIAALLSTTFNADERSGVRAAEVCARIKGGVNRTEAQGDLTNMSVSNGFVDAGAAFEDDQCVPVLNDLKIEGDQGTLTGYFFGTQGSVKIGETNVTDIKSWTANTITFTIPQGLQGKQEVKVTPNGKDYGRNFFQISAATRDYKTLTAPNIKVGEYEGYDLTTADLYTMPMAAAATDTKLAYLGVLMEPSSDKIRMPIYDMATDTWSEVKLPENMDDCTFFSMTAGKSKFYLLYSIEETVKDEKGNAAVKQYGRLGTYDPAANTWKTVNTGLTGSEGLLVYKDQLLAIGGDDIEIDTKGNKTSTAKNTVLIINPETGESTGSLPDLPEGRSDVIARASGDTIMLSSGTNGFWNPEKKTYTSTLSYDGTKWTPHDDHFLTADNEAFDQNQTLDAAFCALNGSRLLAVGPVQGLGTDQMRDTWSFDPSNDNKQWTSVADKLYNQAKTIQIIGAASGGRFYVLGYTGKSEEPLVFRSTAVDYTSPTGDPSGDKPTPPEPSPTVQPTVNPTPTATPTDATTSAKDQNAGTGIFGGPSGMALTAVAVLLLAAGGLVIYRKKRS